MDQEPSIIQPTGVDPVLSTPTPQPSEPKSGKRTFLIIAIIVLLVAGSSYGVYYWQQQQIKSVQASLDAANKQVAKLNAALDAANKQVAKLNAAKTTTTTNPSATWKTYTSSVQKTSFQYPATWTVKTQPYLAGNLLTLTSPTGVVLTYSDFVDGVGGDCLPNSPSVQLTGVNQITTANSPHALYQVESGNQMGLYMDAVPPVVGSTGSCLFYPLIVGNAQPSTQIEFATSLQFDDGTPKPVPANQTADFATAKQILQSFKYGSK